MTEISTTDARRLFLHSQGLIRKAHFGRGSHGTMKAISQLGYVQIDTISVVDRAHHHILATRIPNYTNKVIDQLQRGNGDKRERQVFEYWDHAACYLPFKDYRYSTLMMQGWRQRKDYDKKLANKIHKRLEVEGPLSSRDFEDTRDKNASGWWDWKPAKIALENMFLSGEIMVTRREGFQKVFDLKENVIPSNVDTTMPSHEEWMRFLARRMIRSLGVGTAADAAYAKTAIRRFTGVAVAKDIAVALEELADDRVIERVTIQGRPYYADPAALERLPIRLGARQITFLSPFDPCVINRKRTGELFNFDYLIECYVPAHKRKYGYFCLPILWGDEIIGRMDAKAVRETRCLETRAIHLEPSVKMTEQLKLALRDGLSGFAKQNACEEVKITGVRPPGF